MWDKTGMADINQIFEAAAPGRSDREWSDILGYSRSYIYMIRHGQRAPGRKFIEAVAAATDGAIPPSVWFGGADESP
jgi:hypothetical protein